MKFWVSLLLPRAIYNPAHCVPDLALSKTFIGELKRRETLRRGHRFHEGGRNDGANPAMPPYAAPVVMPSETLSVPERMVAHRLLHLYHSLVKIGF